MCFLATFFFGNSEGLFPWSTVRSYLQISWNIGQGDYGAISCEHCLSLRVLGLVHWIQDLCGLAHTCSHGLCSFHTSETIRWNSAHHRTEQSLNHEEALSILRPWDFPNKNPGVLVDSTCLNHQSQTFLSLKVSRFFTKNGEQQKTRATNRPRAPKNLCATRSAGIVKRWKWQGSEPTRKAILGWTGIKRCTSKIQFITVILRGILWGVLHNYYCILNYYMWIQYMIHNDPCILILILLEFTHVTPFSHKDP